MKSNSKEFHTKLAKFHGKMSTIHGDAADACQKAEDADGEYFHRRAGQEHDQMADFHASAAELPDVEQFGPEGPHKASMVLADPRERWSKAAVPSDVRGVIPDNPQRLAERGLKLQPRFGAPSLEEVAQELDPELRKAVV